MATLDRDGAVFVLDLGDTENRFNADSLAELGALLDEVEAADGTKALVVRATGKYWTNGLDLDWMMADPERAGPLLAGVHALFARVLVMPLPTVAAITGHCYAAGAMLSVAHDIKVMRADRGYWCLPEVDINIPFTRGMAALIQARLSASAAHEAMLTGRRYGGGDAEAAGIVDRAVAEELVRMTALEIAEAQAGKAGDTLATIKARMYAPTLALLRDSADPLGDAPPA